MEVSLHVSYPNLKYVKIDMSPLMIVVLEEKL